MRRNNVSPGGRRKHRKGAGVRQVEHKDDVDTTQEYPVPMLSRHICEFWTLDEVDSFGPVTVYDANGAIVRTITRDALRRPWQEKVGNTWNNCLFTNHISDKV